MNNLLYEFAAFFSKMLSLYSFFIWIRIILSWFNPMPMRGSLTYYFALLVDPFLNLFRSKNFRMGMLDFSPIFAIAALSLLQSILNLFAIYHTIRLSWILSLLLQYLWSYAIHIFLIFIIVTLIIRCIHAFTSFSGLYNVARFSDPIIRKVRETFFKRRLVKETTLCTTAFAISIVLYFVLKFIYQYLLVLVLRIPF